MCWGGIVHGAHKTVTANIYLDMLQLFAFQEEGKEEGGGGKILFLHDGSSPHFGYDLRNIPQLRFPNRWIGIGEPKPWTHEVHSSHN